MKHEVGDIVTIKSKEWYDKNKDAVGDILCGLEYFIDIMSKYCGMVAEITGCSSTRYLIDIDNGCWSWTDEMLEEQVETVEPASIRVAPRNTQVEGSGKLISVPDNCFDTSFFCGDKTVLTIRHNGDILVHDRLVENDKEVVNALREFLGIKKA